jgi:hypothetical protein
MKKIKSLIQAGFKLRNPQGVIIPITPFRLLKVANMMQLYQLIYFSLSALHVSGDVFAHHHEHLTVFTVSGSIHPGCCRLVSELSSNSSKTPTGSNLGEYYQML